MQQVDKKNYKIIFLISILSIFFIVGCSSKNVYSSSTKYYDNNITKDQLLHAVKRVFTLSDNHAFIIDAYRDDLNVTKSKASYKIYTMDIRNDHFDFKVDENTTVKKLKATLAISRTFGIDEKDKYYLENSSGAYELFWDRVDFILGLNEDWRSCRFYHLNDFLCDMIDLDDNDATVDNVIDLNVTSNDLNVSKEKIQISTTYTPKKQNDDYIMTEHTVIHEPSIGSGTKDKNATFDSYKIKKYDIKDYNQTKPYNKTTSMNNGIDG